MDFIQVAQWALTAIVFPLMYAWYQQKEDVVRLKGRVDTMQKDIESIITDRKEIAKEMKEMKDILQQVLIKLTELETYQKIRNELK